MGRTKDGTKHAADAWEALSDGTRREILTMLRHRPHTAGEIAMLLDNGASIVGVNARNLSTFATDLGVVAELMGRIPADKVRVSESALKSNADLKQMKRLGADAFLIGETLMRAASPGEKLCELIAK